MCHWPAGPEAPQGHILPQGLANGLPAAQRPALNLHAQA